MINFGIIGTGMIGRYHRDAIAATPGARLVAVCRGKADAALQASAAAEYGVPCEASLAALLARDDIHAVCICTPSGQHAAQAIAAMQAGKHVLVEKPMALNITDAEAMMAAAQRHSVRLGVALQRRTDPAFQRIHHAIAQGDFGNLVLGKVSVPYLRSQAYYDSAEWRGTWVLDGGGVLMNQGIHLLDLLLWFMGDVVSVQAQAATLGHQIEVEDCLSASLKFANGALASVIATTCAAPGFPHRVEIYGTRAGVQIEGEQIVRWEGENAPKDAVRLSASAVSGMAAAGAGASPTGISNLGHQRIIADFVNAIHQQREPLVNGVEGLRSLRAALAIYAAAKT